MSGYNAKEKGKSFPERMYDYEKKWTKKNVTQRKANERKERISLLSMCKLILCGAGVVNSTVIV